MSKELWVFYASAMSGVLFGMVYHITKAIKNKVAHLPVVCGVVDFFYCVFVTLFMAYVLLVTNDAKLRFYELLAVALGGNIYFFTVGRWFLLGFEYILGIILKIFDFILKILLTPVRFLDKILLYKFKSGGGVKNNAKKEKTAPEVGT